MEKKELGFFDVFSIAAGSMISTGIFVLPAIVFSNVGPGVVLAYLLAGLFCIPAMFAQLELATAMPKAGGSYFTIERSLGAFAGTLAGFISWLCISLKSAFACVGIGALVILLMPGNNEFVLKATAIAACLFFAILNTVSVKGSGSFQKILVAFLLAILILYLAKGFPLVDARKFHPFMNAGWDSFLAITGMVFISFGGVTKVVDVAGEIKNPARNLPMGIFLAFGIVNILYVLVVFVTTGILEKDVFANTLAPVSMGAQISMGQYGVWLISIASLFAYATTANAGILSASRSPMAMSKDGLLPEVLSRKSLRFSTPYTSIALTTLFVILVIAFLSVEDLAKTASTMFLISYVLINISVLVMRKAGIQGYRPSFSVPLYPWVPIAGIILYSSLIIDMGKTPLLVAGGFMGAASIWYVCYVQKRIDRVSAVVYMVQNILSNHIKRTGLEDELVQISIEREEREEDIFDQLVRNAQIIDIKEQVSAKELFEKLGSSLSEKLKLSPNQIYELLIKREAESSTVIQPGLAIPHIIVEGENVFELALVRCKEGAVFSEINPPVHTAFTLIGSVDKRNLHLKALVAIANIVQEKDFMLRWLEAKNPEQLRDIILLSRRERFKPKIFDKNT